VGSPGTFSLSEKKSKVIRDVLAVGPSRSRKEEVPKLAPNAAAFFKEVLKDKTWAGLIAGKEWRTCANLLVKSIAEANILSRTELESWIKKQKVETTSESPLIELGDRWVEKLDKELGERDIIAYELSTYALRQTLEQLYSPDKSPFDMRTNALLKGLKTVDTRTAFKVYVESYLKQVVRYIIGGFLPEDSKEEKKRLEFLTNVEKKAIPKLADQFLSSLEEFSTKESGAGRAISLRLKEAPKWIEKVKEILAGETEK
jgi:hypothetical protein